METNTTDMWFSAGDVSLQGTLAIPAGARGIVIFVHGSGSSRSSLETGRWRPISNRHTWRPCSSIS